MSGGHFDYKQYELGYLADEVEQFIVDHDPEHGYSEATIMEFKQAIYHLRHAQIYLHRIDWLVSGDDSESTFHARLDEEVERYLLGAESKTIFVQDYSAESSCDAERDVSEALSSEFNPAVAELPYDVDTGFITGRFTISIEWSPQ